MRTFIRVPHRAQACASRHDLDCCSCLITLAGGQARRRATRGRAGTSRTAFGTNCRSAPVPLIVSLYFGCILLRIRFCMHPLIRFCMLSLWRSGLIKSLAVNNLNLMERGPKLSTAEERAAAPCLTHVPRP